MKTLKKSVVITSVLLALSALPVAAQEGFCGTIGVGSIDPVDASVSWQGAFNDYLAAKTNLTANQTALLEEARNLGTADFFSIEPGSERWIPEVRERTQDLAERAELVFSQNEFQEFLALMRALPESLVTTARDAAVATLYYCTCSSSDNKCPLGDCKTSKCKTWQLKNSEGQVIKEYNRMCIYKKPNPDQQGETETQQHTAMGN